MRDAHVVSLHYRLVPAEGVTFSPRAEPVKAEADGFAARLAGGALDVTMLDHHPGEESARAAVEPYLRSWEISHALSVGGQPEFRFEFVRAEVVDRDPPPPGTHQIVALQGHVSASSYVSATLSVERASLPSPPTGFIADAEVAMLWARWRGYREGREPLPTMAYFALTVIERHGTGGRRRFSAAARFGIDPKVLDTLGRLSSERGDPTSARKALAASSPLTPTEAAWVQAAVPAMIRRVGEVAADPAAASRPLTMSDLPEL